MKQQLASFHHVSTAYFDERVLEDITLTFFSTETVGVVGRNGAGKSSLLKCLCGILPADDGTIVRAKNLKIGYLPQESELAGHKLVLEVMQDAHPALSQVERELSAAEDLLGQPDVYGDPTRLEAVLARQDRLLEEFVALGGPSQANTILATLRRIGIDDTLHHQPVHTLSGGQQKLLALARILVSRPDLLVLDEPDNHLDIQGKQLLERIVDEFAGGVVIVSHDRYLLDFIADSILEMESRKAIVWPGNYSEYVVQKEIAVNRQRRQFQAQQKEIQRLEASMARLMYWGSVFDNPKFISRAKSMQKRIDRIDRIEEPLENAESMRLALANRRSSQKVLVLQDVSLRFPDATEDLLQDLELTIWRGERVGLVGPNGAGKSVLLQLIRGERAPTTGRVILGPNVTVGFYDQEHRNLDYNKTLVESVRHHHKLDEATVVSFLRTFQFSYRQCQERVQSLSGGERSRFQMALLMLRKPSFLMLDEPTNNLDIESAEVLEEALLGFQGAMLLVSHDRYFLDRLVDRVVVLADHRLQEYRGTFTEYLMEEAMISLDAAP